MQPSRRQTLTFLKQRFAEVGLSPVKRHGQNFLIDLNLLRRAGRHGRPAAARRGARSRHGHRLADGADGAAAWRPSSRSRSIPQLHQLASEELIDFDNVTMLLQDALRNKNNLDESVLERGAAAALLSSRDGGSSSWPICPTAWRRR